VRFDFGHPGGIERLAGGHRHRVGGHIDRQHLAHLGVLQAHHLGDPADIDLQRVDAQVRQLDPVGQPLRQRLGVERAALVLQPGAAQPHQRVQAGAAGAEALDHPLRVVVTDPAVVAQPAQQLQPVEPATRSCRGRAGDAVDGVAGSGADRRSGSGAGRG
jgi:hypothetical protein